MDLLKITLLKKAMMSQNYDVTTFYKGECKSQQTHMSVLFLHQNALYPLAFVPSKVEAA